MKSKAMTTVLVKLGNIDENEYGYKLKMGIIEIYPSDTDICSPIDFDEETIVVTATIGMLSGYSIEQLKSAAEKCYIGALQGYIKEKWDVMSIEEKLRLINYVLSPDDLRPSMSADEMMRKIEQISKDESDLYVALAHAYAYALD